MEQVKIDRINELARKKKSVGLTPDEISEQDTLRKEYISEFRSNLKAQLDNTVIEYPNGEKKYLSKK